MTKEQAIKILNEALSNIQATRQTHQLLAQALDVLSAPRTEDKTK